MKVNIRDKNRKARYISTQRYRKIEKVWAGRQETWTALKTISPIKLIEGFALPTSGRSRHHRGNLLRKLTKYNLQTNKNLYKHLIKLPIRS
ncbi:hypothetical protein ElyMa_005764100 [Elysia marginata]|uniref:Uncharacterized protein n=1 Tax=Elysia marginata TaxID=1093978 RepID=A0AAV4FPH8_9GAST|nr:hypothetical protein ElyMa_005764100 [Elysia marginata]